MRASDPATTPSTARILVDRALNCTCGQECVDWATAMLAGGASGTALATLAGMIPPFNHFELADLRDRALRELGIAELDKPTAAHLYAAECLRAGLDGHTDLVKSFRIVADLCVALNYDRDLNDFYLLHHAHNDLKDATFSFHWYAATRENIMSIMTERARAFLHRLH